MVIGLLCHFTLAGIMLMPSIIRQLRGNVGITNSHLFSEDGRFLKGGLGTNWDSEWELLVLGITGLVLITGIASVSSKK